jgi:hypothetical protein
VLGVDVRCLYLDQTLRVVRRRPESFAQELRHDVNELCVQSRESLEFLGQVVSRERVEVEATKVTLLVQLWQILTSSSYTNSTHRRLGDSNSLICGFTSKSNAVSGMNKLGRGPFEFLIAVRMS